MIELPIPQEPEAIKRVESLVHEFAEKIFQSRKGGQMIEMNGLETIGEKIADLHTNYLIHTKGLFRMEEREFHHLVTLEIKNLLALAEKLEYESSLRAF